MLLVETTTEDDDAEPAEAPGVQRFGAPEVQVALSSRIVPPVERRFPEPVGEVEDLPTLSPLHDLDPHTESYLLERFSPLDDEQLRPARRRAGGIRRTCVLIGRVVAVAVVVLLVLTVAPFGRPEGGSIVAGSNSSSPFAEGSGPSTTGPEGSTTSTTQADFTFPQRTAVPLHIDIAEIALAVDPASLGFVEPDADGWVEPRVEPEAQWTDSGNGVALPDLLLRIRFCESSNNYRAAHVTSSARGAYQFLAKSWEWYGHAERYGVPEAHLASPAQQDEAALTTYREFGARPWAESRHCWDDPNIDERYLTTRPAAPAPAPTTTTPPADTTEAPSASDSTTTSAESTTSEAPPVTAASTPETSAAGG